MDLIASYGLSAYWYLKREMAKVEMNEDFKNKYPLYAELEQMLKNSKDDYEFYNQFMSEVASNHIHIYFGELGERIEIPNGYTVTDVGYSRGVEFGNMMDGAKVKEQPVPYDYQLKTNDRLIIKTNPLSYGPRTDLIDKCNSVKTKKLIYESYRK